MKTDSQLQHDVDDALRREPKVTSSQIGVSVKDGVVTLSGEVGHDAEKWSAEQAAQHVSGVDAMAVELAVKRSELGERTDADIARSAETALATSTAVPAGAVIVMVEQGFISLTGTVDSQSEKTAAAVCLHSLAGVRGVSNQIAVTPSLSVSAVEADIEAALERTGDAKAHAIEVAIDGAEVTLMGQVQTWADLEVVTRSASASPGVGSVINKMTLAQ